MLTQPLARGFFYGLAMQQAQQQILQILNQNQGNRLTFELINGLAARLQMVVSEYGKRVSEPLQKELADLRGQAQQEGPENG